MRPAEHDGLRVLHAAGSDDDAVVALCRAGADLARAHVGRDQPGIALERIAVAGARERLDADGGASAQRKLREHRGEAPLAPRTGVQDVLAERAVAATLMLRKYPAFGGNVGSMTGLTEW